MKKKVFTRFLEISSLCIVNRLVSLWSWRILLMVNLNPQGPVLGVRFRALRRRTRGEETSQGGTVETLLRKIRISRPVRRIRPLARAALGAASSQQCTTTVTDDSSSRIQSLR